jgi:ATP-binding cassette subfamily C (CFTR/MRP) protein 1
MLIKVEILALLLIGTQLGLLICWSSNLVTRATVPSAALSFLAAVAILLLSLLEDSRSVKPSFVLNIYLLASVVFDAVQARTLYLRHEKSAILGLFTTSIAIKFALLVVESRSKRQWLRPPYNSYSPEATSGIFSRSFFWWINPILTTGFRKLITLDDLFTTDISLKSEVLLDEIEASWAKCKSCSASDMYTC